MPFARQRLRHEFAVRHVTVRRVSRIVPAIVRVTFSGKDLDGFTSAGPADHVKVFFPDQQSGMLVVPTVTPDGIEPPEHGTPISRDYTPLAFRAAADGNAAELDIDFVLHGDEGPASAWAARATPGDVVAIGGPRGSQLAPEGVGRLILVADETALPAASRWLAAVDPAVPVTALFFVADESVSGYLPAEVAERVDARWLSGSGAGAGGAGGASTVGAALRELGPIGGDTYVFLAGEAGALIPLRRYLRRELGLPAEQVSASGYWKRGVAALDHHAPVDPSDPD
ncbi:siderophore-interacting protein [Leifsonia sp. PS1209]|uniref:siderophore-interacting protein n=1 Tax=Leifsonia sp. PS1209 TaxID=2724914 RepID=UPI001442D10E|nr:siderophore-interacting protein [Leifsonia sp. PS1209]QIZ99489.1 siderophore-interacting protein [Leifsonia sp. PS1209]